MGNSNSNNKYSNNSDNNNNNNYNNYSNSIIQTTNGVNKVLSIEEIQYFFREENKENIKAEEINNYIKQLKDNLYYGLVGVQQVLPNFECIFYATSSKSNYESIREYFRSLSKPICCSKVWGPKTMFYRCKTCAKSPNSSICFECFKAGPHEKEGHDYSMSFASYGGSCDCGSLDSWKEEGFCGQHKHPEEDRIPTKDMDKLHLLTTHLVFRHLLVILLEINRSPPTNQSISLQLNERSQYVSIQIIKWITEMAHLCRSIAHVLSEELCYQSLDPAIISPKEFINNNNNNKQINKIPPIIIKPLLYTDQDYQIEILKDEEIIKKSTLSKDTPNSSTSTSISTSSTLPSDNNDINERLFKFDYQILYEFRPPLYNLLNITDDSIRQEYMNLLLYLLCEHTFKFGFSQSYLKVYKSLCYNSTVDILFRFSPQIFSVCSVSEQFSIDREYGFIDCIFESLFFHLADNKKLDKNHIAIVSDLKTILQHKSIAHYMIYSNRKYLESYIRLLQTIQSSSDDEHGDYQKRFIQSHIPYEDTQWIQFFQIDTEFKEISNILIDSLSSSTDSIEGLKDMFHFICDHLITDPELNGMVKYQGVPCTKRDLFKGEKPVTTTLPFHRFLGIALNRIKQLYPAFPLSDLIPKKFNFNAFIYQFVLANVYCQQVNSNFWVRNGDVTVKKKAYVYSLFFLELDLSILQLAASITDINEFLIFSSKEFNSIIPYGNNDSSIQDGSNNNGNLINSNRYSHFFKFLIQILQERLFFMTTDEHTKYTLIQLLSSRPKTHSQIDSVMNYVERELNYEHILREISEEIHTNSDNPYHYKMKNEYWKQFNFYYPLFTPYILGEESLQTFLEYKKKNSIEYPESLPCPPLIECSKEIPKDRMNFLSIIQSDYLLYLFNQVMVNYIHGSDESNEIGCGINDVLYLLLFILEKNKQMSPPPMQFNDDLDWDQFDHSIQQFNQQSNTTNYSNSVKSILQNYLILNKPSSIFTNLIEMYNDSVQNNLYQDKIEYIERSLIILSQFNKSILNRIVFRCKSPLKDKLNQISNKDDADQTNSSQPLSPNQQDDSKKMDARKRQAEIMARFAQQQSKFLETANDMDFESSDEEDHHAKHSSKKKSSSNTPFSSPSSKSNNATPITTGINDSNGIQTNTSVNNSGSSPYINNNKNIFNGSKNASPQINGSREWFNENLKNKECVLCHETHTNDFDPLSLISFLQPSRMIAYAKNSYVAKKSPELQKYETFSRESQFFNFPQKRDMYTLNYMSSLHIRSCGHYIHKKCYKKYFPKVLNQENEETTFKPSLKEFLCPLCRRIGNVIIPTYTESSVTCSPIISGIDFSNLKSNTYNLYQQYQQQHSNVSSPLALNDNNNNNLSNSNSASNSNDNIYNLSQPQPTTTTTTTTTTTNNTPQTPMPRPQSALLTSSSSSSSSLNTLGTNNGLIENWINGLKKRLKDIKFIEPRGELFFSSSINELMVPLIEGVTGMVYFQMVAKNIELLELSSRIHYIKKDDKNGTKTEKVYPITNELFNRDMLTIHTLYNLVGILAHQAIDSKFKERLIEILKGKSSSILSIDPFSLFIVLTVVLGSPTQQDIDIIVNLILNLFITQFYLTNLYLEKEILNKKSNNKKSISVLFNQQFNQSNNYQKEKLKEKLECSLEVLLKCMFIAIQFIYPSNINNNSNNNNSIKMINGQKIDNNSNGINYICKEDLTNKELILSKLNIGGSNNYIDDLVTQSFSNQYLSSWLTQLESKKLEPFFIIPYTRPEFIDLPRTYEDFFVNQTQAECNHCRTKPDTSAICLLCGTLVCIKSDCCNVVEKGISLGEAYLHTLRCGYYRVGLFIECKSPKVDILRDYRKSSYNNIYLDSYGEPDPQLERGKPLILNDRNYLELWNYWITHSLEDKYLANSSLNSRIF